MDGEELSELVRKVLEKNPFPEFIHTSDWWLNHSGFGVGRRRHLRRDSRHDNWNAGAMAAIHAIVSSGDSR